MKNPLALLHEIHDMVTGMHTVMVGPREEKQTETLPGIDAPEKSVTTLIPMATEEQGGAEFHSNVYKDGELTVSFEVIPENSSIELDAYRNGNLVARLTLFPLQMAGNKDSLVDKVIAFTLSHLSWVGIGTALVSQFAGPLRDEVNSLIHK